MPKNVISLLVLSSLFFPIGVHASVVLSEIMYDLEGADSGREWVEVFNTGAESISLTDWKFFENGTNHKLTLISGSETIGSGEYAVIVDNSEKFLLDWPGFSGTLFDSAFSLSNSGETLTLRDSALVDIDSYTYSSETGAAGDGNTLSKQSNGDWVSASPTPGSGTLVATLSASTASETETTSTTHTTTSSGVSIPVVPQIFADAGDDRVVLVGADSIFEADAWGLEGKPLSGARFLWNFGDGSFKEGKKVLHHYDFPGGYVVMLHVSSDVYTATDSFVVTADPARLAITQKDNERVIVTNDASYRVDISGWMIREGTMFFVFPEGTVLLPKTSVSISHEVSNLSGVESVLLYPNGEVVAETIEEIGPEITAGSIKPAVHTTRVVGTAVSQSAYASIETEEAVQEITEEEVKEDQVAAVSATSEKSGNALWYVLLIILIGMGAVATFFLARNEKEFEIIDESED